MTPMPSRAATSALLGSAHVRAWIVAALAATTGVLSAVAMRDGPGMTVDSVRYAAAARSVLDSGEPTTLTGDPFTVFPPGLPILLGTIMRAGLDVEAAAAVAGVAAAAATPATAAAASTSRPARMIVPSRIGSPGGKTVNGSPVRVVGSPESSTLRAAAA